jgi:hypothetical protein
MRSHVTVTQEFQTWAAACAARDYLAHGGLLEYGIDRVDIERLNDRFELVIRTDEFHRDQIEHLLRSTGTPLNPTREGGSGWAKPTPLVIAGIATAAVAGLFLALWPRRERRRAIAERPQPRPRSGTDAAAGVAALRPEASATIPMFTLEAGGSALAVTKGNEGEARAIFESADFRGKLRRMESDGRALWDGAAPFRIRPASPAEVRAFVQYAETLGLEDEEEGDIVLYLTPVDGADEFDETQDG